MQPRIIRVSDYVDKQFTCIECGDSFVFNAGEQAFFASKGFQSVPKRCPACRKFRRLSLVLDDRPTTTVGRASDQGGGNGS
jgi:Probable zinc-ribbon domain